MARASPRCKRLVRGVNSDNVLITAALDERHVTRETSDSRRTFPSSVYLNAEKKAHDKVAVVISRSMRPAPPSSNSSRHRRFRPWGKRLFSSRFEAASSFRGVVERSKPPTVIRTRVERGRTKGKRKKRSKMRRNGAHWLISSEFT